MRILLTTLVFAAISYSLTAQNLKQIAAYDNNSSTTSGLYAIGDTAIYRYSWYYQEWFPLSNNGLVSINDTTQLNAIAVYNNESTNSSGLFVFSDTAVYNYNWITTLWYPLSNNGLPRISGKPDVRGLAVYGPAGSSSNSTLFALSDTAVFRYSWYYQQWTPLSNNGLATAISLEDESSYISALAYPNPFNDEFNIIIEIPETTSGAIDIVLFDIKGNFVLKETHLVNTGEKMTIKPHLHNVSSGLYYMEIFDGHLLKKLKLICVN